MSLKIHHFQSSISSPNSLVQKLFMICFVSSFTSPHWPFKLFLPATMNYFNLPNPSSSLSPLLLPPLYLLFSNSFALSLSLNIVLNVGDVGEASIPVPFLQVFVLCTSTSPFQRPCPLCWHHPFGSLSSETGP